MPVQNMCTDLYIANSKLLLSDRIEVMAHGNTKKRKKIKFISILVFRDQGHGQKTLNLSEKKEKKEIQI